MKRVAIVGCGVVARRHAAEIAADGRAALVIVADANSSRAEALAAEFAPKARLVSPDALFEWKDAFDVLLVCTPTQNHFAPAAKALGLGIAVLCEKPLAATRAEIVELIELQRATGTPLAVAYQRRGEGPYVAARNMLADPAADFGMVKEIHVYVCERWRQTIDGTWRNESTFPSGYFGDAGSHQIDVVQFITGHMPVELFAWNDRRDANVAIATRVFARTNRDATLVAHFVGDANAWHEDIRIHCERGDVLLRDCVLSTARGNRTEIVDDIAPYRAPISKLLDSLEVNSPVIAPATGALAMFDWTEAVLRSAATGAWQKVGTSISKPDN